MEDERPSEKNTCQIIAGNRSSKKWKVKWTSREGNQSHGSNSGGTRLL